MYYSFSSPLLSSSSTDLIYISLSYLILNRERSGVQRRLKEEQDMEFQESLQIDQEKSRLKREQDAKEEAERMEAEQQRRIEIEVRI